MNPYTRERAVLPVCARVRSSRFMIAGASRQQPNAGRR
jgi:hypothetical protein